jgi:hypothetical protein
MKTLGIIFFESWGFTRVDIVVSHSARQYHEKKADLTQKNHFIILLN